MWLTIYNASNDERHRTMPGDSIILNPIYTETRAMLMIALAAFGHGIMETRQLHGLKLRAEARLR